MWSEQQTEATRQYDKVVDYPFPNVVPQSTEKDISLLADEIVEDVINNYGLQITVHIMGEFTLCYALIKRFQQRNITCIASCTERNVTENANCEKIVRFEFKQFRRYE